MKNVLINYDYLQECFVLNIEFEENEVKIYLSEKEARSFGFEINTAIEDYLIDKEGGKR